ERARIQLDSGGVIVAGAGLVGGRAGRASARERYGAQLIGRVNTIHAWTPKLLCVTAEWLEIIIAKCPPTRCQARCEAAGLTPCWRYLFHNYGCIAPGRSAGRLMLASFNSANSPRASLNHQLSLRCGSTLWLGKPILLSRMKAAGLLSPLAS